MRTKRVVMTLIFALLFFLYADFWQWNKIEPLIFGWMPWHVFHQVLLNVGFVVAYALLAYWYSGKSEF